MKMYIQLHLLFCLCLPYHFGTLHYCANGSKSLEAEDLVVEDKNSDKEDFTLDVFEPTWEWKEVKDGQAIPAGLHVRMNLETGFKQAKLLSPEEEDDETSTEESSFQPQTSSQSSLQTSDKDQEKNSKFVADTRRSDYYGKSDRRGAINKRTKLFSKQELSEMLKNLKDDGADLSNLPQIATSDVDSTGKVNKLKHSSDLEEPQLASQEHVPLSLSFHRDVEAMLQHTQTLAVRNSSISEILFALEELEYYVHQIDNARDLNVIGGLVLVVRMLNHTTPEVRSHAAHVIGSAAQSNPQVQEELIDYGSLPLLCSLLQLREPDLVQRRALFALSALLRGSSEQQKLFVNKYQGLSLLGTTFNDRSAPVQLKVVTLLTDILHEQIDLQGAEITRDELLTLFNQVLEHGWCQHVAALIHTESLTQVEKGLQAMEVLSVQNICSFTGQLPQLRRLMEQFTMESTSADSDLENEFVQSLVEQCSNLVIRIRQLNMEL